LFSQIGLVLLDGPLFFEEVFLPLSVGLPSVGQGAFSAGIMTDISDSDMHGFKM